MVPDNLDKEYDALVFDMDGTLADTMPTHFAAWSRALGRHGITLGEARFYELGGVPAPVVVELLASEQGVAADAAAVAEEKENLFVELVGEVRPVAPVRVIAETYRGRMPMAVATGSPRWLAERILGALGVAAWFGAVVTADCVERPKPAPDIYRRAAELLGVSPGRCHAFEDTQLGLRAARAAGMTAVDIHTLE